MTERMDLYDADRCLLNMTVDRNDRAPEGCYKIVVHVCVFNGRNEMLIQRRQIKKTVYPGCWDISCSGAVSSGENSLAAARRELKEELGLEFPVGAVRPVITVNNREGFGDVYVLNMEPDLNELVLQPDEVSDAAWADEETVLKMIDDGTFLPYRKEYIRLLFAFRGKRGVLMERAELEEQPGPASYDQKDSSEEAEREPEPEKRFTEDTRLSEILDAYPWMREELPKKDPRLGIINTAIGRMMIGRMTVGDAARKTGIPADKIISEGEKLISEYEKRKR